MLKLVPHIRKIVLFFSSLIAVFVLVYFGNAQDYSLANYKYVQYFALLAFTF